MAVIRVHTSFLASYEWREDESVYVLHVSDTVPVSEHTHRFKDMEVMYQYLDWLFGEGQWTT